MYPHLKSLSVWAAMGLAGLFLVGAGQGGCAGGTAQQGDSSNLDTAEKFGGGSVATNPVEEAKGGSVAQNPAGMVLLSGSFNELKINPKTTDPTTEQPPCEAESVVIVTSDLKQHHVKVKPDDCSWVSAPIQTPVALALVVNSSVANFEFDVSKLGGDVAYENIKVDAAPEIPATTLDIGLITVDETSGVAIEHPLKDDYSEFVLPELESPQVDINGFYLAATINDRSLGGMPFCPYYKHTVKLELNQSKVSTNELELTIHWKELGMGAGPTVPNQIVTKGTIEAGFFETSGETQINTMIASAKDYKPFSVECRGWVENTGALDLDTVCYFKYEGVLPMPQPTDLDAILKIKDPLMKWAQGGACYYWDAEKQDY